MFTEALRAFMIYIIPEIKLNSSIYVGISSSTTHTLMILPIAKCFLLYDNFFLSFHFYFHRPAMGNNVNVYVNLYFPHLNFT